MMSTPFADFLGHRVRKAANEAKKVPELGMDKALRRMAQWMA
jgi:hypothetical protein